MKKTIIISLVAIAGLFLFSTTINASPFDWVKNLFQKNVFGGTLCYPYQGCTGRNMSADTGVVTVTSGTFNATTTLTLDNLTVNNVFTLSGQVDPGPLVVATTSAPSIRWATDTDTGIGTITDDTITLMTGGEHRLFVDTNGNIAIGTSTTAGLFTVGTTTDPILNITTDGNLAFGTTTPLGLFTVGTTSNAIFNITSEGYVGIGTTTPTQALYVYETRNQDGYGYPATFQVNNGLGSSYVTIQSSNQAYNWYNTTLWDGTSWVAGSETDGVSNVFRISSIYTGSVGNRTARLTILPDGSVGIGTTTQTALLDVYAATDTTAVLIEQDSTGDILDVQNATGTILSINNAGTLTIGTASTTEGKLEFNTLGATEAIPFIRGSGGNIEFVTPTGWLIFNLENGIQVQGNWSDIWWTANSGSGAWDMYNGSANTAITIKNSASAAYRADLILQSGYLTVGTSTQMGIFTVGTTTNPIFNITTEGYIGVGTSTPDSLLNIYNTNSTSTVMTIGGNNSFGCLKIRDADNTGWTYCTTQGGAMNCSAISCE